jgi:hypothetical protein
MTTSFKTQDVNRRLHTAMTDLGCGGEGPAEVAGALGWTRRRLRATADGPASLSNALERTRDAELAWWEARARTGVSGRPNAALWGRAMAGRFASEGYGRVIERVEPEKPPEHEDMTRWRAKAVLALLDKVGMADQVMSPQRREF